ncbi:hypothetical protein TrVFT333_011397 [Trichoderma virens FT-333]|nr:hypothetical protein TrVFT333_011397 [Trichoderma virens FT-333]
MADVAIPDVPMEVDFIPTEKLVLMSAQRLRSFVMRRGPQEARKGPWSPEESQRLVALVQVMGPQDWVCIASFMVSRNAKQCRERYHQNLDPTLRHDPITEDEAFRIMELYRKYGTAWARIAEQLPGRSDNAIKNYVNGLVNKNRRAEERQASHQHAAKRRGSAQSIRSAASPSASHSLSASSSTALTPSSFGSRSLESPTFSDMTEADGGNHYALSSNLPWAQFTPHASPPRWHRPLAQSPELTHPKAHHHTLYQQPPPYEASPYGPPYGQNGHNYIQQHDNWRPVSRSSEPASFLDPATRRPSTDLARYSISGAVVREPTREVEMLDYELPRIQPPWAGNDVHKPMLLAPEQSAIAAPPSHQADPRMSIASLLT